MHFLALESTVPEGKPMKTSKTIFNLSAGHAHRHNLNEYTFGIKIRSHEDELRPFWQQDTQRDIDHQLTNFQIIDSRWARGDMKLWFSSS
jgi:hypothetical protein